MSGINKVKKIIVSSGVSFKEIALEMTSVDFSDVDSFINESVLFKNKLTSFDYEYLTSGLIAGFKEYLIKFNSKYSNEIKILSSKSTFQDKIKAEKKFAKDLFYYMEKIEKTPAERSKSLNYSRQIKNIGIR